LSAAEGTGGLTPSSASPVLKTEITVQLATNYPETMVVDDFTVMLYSYNDTTYERELYVMRADDSTKTLVVKFPGAESGLYYMQVISTQHGYLDSDTLILEVHGTVTSVSPLTGSVYGGTLVTITGENFGTYATDNPVKIGSEYCYVLTTEATQITCRTDMLPSQNAQDELIIVFLRTSEEAATPNNEDMLFTYIQPTTIVDSLSVAFDETTFSHKLTVTGTGIDETLYIVIDGYTQIMDSQNDNEAIFSLSNLSGVSTTDIQFFTSMGYPGGAEITHSLDVAPAIMAIDPVGISGSHGGSRISVTGSGFGVDTVGLNLLAGN